MMMPSVEDGIWMLIGIGIGVLICFIAWIGEQFWKQKYHIEPKNIGKLYIHEGDTKDRYSFAFDCPLDDLKMYDRVLLNVEIKKAETELQIIDRMEKQYYGEDAE